MQVSSGVCTKVQKVDHIWEDQVGCGTDTEHAVQEERDRNHRSGVLQRSCAYAGKDTAQVQRVGDHGVSEREKLADDIRAARKPKVQIWEPSFLVQGILCGYGGKEYQADSGIHCKPAERGSRSGSDDPERVYRPVHG